MNFFSKFNRIATLAYSGVIISATLLFSSLYQESKVYILNALRLQLTEQSQSLNFVLRIRADAVKSIKSQAESFLSEPPNPNFRPHLVSEYDNGIFTLNKSTVNKANVGNLTGLMTVEKISSELWHEITMAYRLNPLFRVLLENNRSIRHAYYISNREFSNIYPWLSPKKTYYCMENFKHGLCQLVLHAGTSKDGLYWTDIYLSPDNVLMMTCAASVYSKNHFKGVVSIDFTLSSLSSFVESLHHKFGRLIVINDHHSILEDTGAYNNAIENNLKLQIEDTLPDGLEIEQILKIHPNKITKLGNYWVFQSSTAHAPWTVVYYVSAWEITLAALRNIGPGFILIFVFATIILVAANRIIVQEFIQPTERLVTHITSQGRSKVVFSDLKEPWLRWFETVSKVFEENRNLVKTLEQNIQDLDRQVLKRTNDLYKRNKQLQDAINNLKKAQSKIIFQEKMAGLGALTAGIAHELKNPLNFVINFSEISRTFLEDLKRILNKTLKQSSKADQEQIKKLLVDLLSNIHRIEKHGRHADMIIHSMLVHARGGSDAPHEADLNDLLRENILLLLSSFKQKGFTPQIKTSFDPKLTPVKIYHQDLSRALLNIVMNAFDALLEKKLKDKNYEPLLEIWTKDKKDFVEIGIKDNGPGVNEKHLKKIFEPFFTTKPTGQGTGLGLSLSYDIISQQHKGTMTINTKKGEFTEFVITLPKNINKA
ncbi:sensor histidine kinase [Candidatus Nucleicultrix amoebiphila]|jgi:signal transduction histidine kinase|uniref:sensor histidine kinase n=1 Tax=Candidatus Nucleicultrix amoebiphila TaxID=1509244 RepID=UPI000A269104|nr:ATP-binding protein [Candidatus Nucleicultrix amoebiphila]